MTDPLATVLPTLPRERLQELVSLGSELRLRTGGVLCAPDMMPAGLCILMKGSLTVMRDGRYVSTLKPGAVIGEGSLFRGTFPSVTIAAAETCRLIVMPMDAVHRHLEADPAFAYQFVRAIVVELTGRLQNTSRLLAENGALAEELAEKNTALERALSSLAETHDQLLREGMERQRAEAEAGDLAAFVLEAPNPMLRVGPDGRIAYANPAAQPILAAWRTGVGKLMPKKWRWLLQEALTLGQVRNGEMLAAKRQYHLQVKPRLDRGEVSIYGHDITLAKATEARILHLANHDPLTGLANRSRFLEELSQTIEMGGEPALFYLDLDFFKDVNDTHGHHVGDQLLQAVGRRIKAVSREEDRVARLGGDEFAMIRTDGTDRADLQTTAERLVHTLSQPFSIDGIRVRIGVSIGIASVPDNGSNAETLTRNADQAMYRAKHEGRNRYCFHQPPAAAAAVTRQAEGEIRRALEQDQFVLHYQPKVDLAGGQAVGVEAFLRWNHPKRGLLMPGQFIHLVERVGLAGPLSDWVLRTACREGREWLDAGVPLKLAINLSPAQVKDPALTATLLGVLRDSGIPPARLELEISEPEIREDEPQMIETLNGLRELGVEIAIDDFGTGQSSLTFLRRFPIAKIKIDESFVHDAPMGGEAATVVRTIIALGDSLGLTVVAEGIETAQQLTFLMDHGCHEGQGFHLGKPVPAVEVAALLRPPLLV